MRWRIITVGKPALTYARIGSEEYLKRLRRHARVELQHLRATPEPRLTARMDEAAGADSLRIVLDERGRSDLDTEGMKRWLEMAETDGGRKDISVLVGGADGHSAETRASADLLLSLSPFTLQHELALVIFLEQLYRIYTLRAGSPYHRP